MFVARRLLLAVLALAPFAHAAALDQSPLTSNLVADKVEIVDCGAPTDAVLLKSVEISPDPPKPGEPVTVTVTGTVQERLNDGAWADVTVKVGLIKLLQKRFDVCEEASNSNATIQCPVDPDTYTIVQTVELPKEIPPAKFSVAVRGFTAEEEDMLCINLKINFLPQKGIWPFSPLTSPSPEQPMPLRVPNILTMNLHAY
ncbi:ML domain-containing protein [Auriculariales sp. MPI-PUGE-AT-0066]|nr:ML domain-containing protein [Auriculariales sp. MPI-PUGE-AT-0066]